MWIHKWLLSSSHSTQLSSMLSLLLTFSALLVSVFLSCFFKFNPLSLDSDPILYLSVPTFLCKIYAQPIVYLGLLIFLFSLTAVFM